MDSDRKRVWILIDWHGSCARGVLRGIRSNPVSDDWDVLLRRPENCKVETALEQGANGVIGWFRRICDDEKDILLNGPAAVVNVLSIDEFPEAPTVGEEHREVGRIAAEYFLDRGYRSFAYATPTWKLSSQKSRRDGFRETIGEQGWPCEVHDPKEDDEPLDHWLLRLPKPLALLAHYDVLGREVVEACRTCGLRVPDDVAVLGVDNDEIYCDLSRPRLSSIAFPWERIGWCVAEMMEKQLSGEPLREQRILVPPTGVVARESTDFVAVEDDVLTRAMRFIFGHAAEGIGVGDVARHCALSRRSLERRFRGEMNCSPLDQIRRTRLRAAQVLLRTTDLTVKEIAAKSGFGGPERFCVVFREHCGVTPLSYRNQ